MAWGKLWTSFRMLPDDLDANNTKTLDHPHTLFCNHGEGACIDGIGLVSASTAALASVQFTPARRYETGPRRSPDGDTPASIGWCREEKSSHTSPRGRSCRSGVQ
jgi:hypothetical protein